MGTPSSLDQHDEQDHHQKDHRNQNQNLEDGSDRQTKQVSNSVHVSTCLQRDNETREHTKADNGLSHNLALPRAAASASKFGSTSSKREVRPILDP